MMTDLRQACIALLKSAPEHVTDHWQELDEVVKTLAQPEQEFDAPDVVVVDESDEGTNTMSWVLNLPLPVGTRLYTAPPKQPEQEPTVPDNMQDWANLDGDIAWHLIERHADNWADIKKMMDEFVSAKIASAQSKHECETCANKRKRLEQSGFLKSPLRGEE